MRLTQDVISGAAIIALAAGLLLVLSRIPQTSYQTIAPDLFPRICAYGLLLGGVVLVLRGMWRGSPAVTLPDWRATLFVLAAIVGFGLLAPRIGYAPAGLLTLIIGGLGSHEVRFGQLVVFSVGIIVFSVLLFSVLLKLTMPVLILPGLRV